MLDLSSPTFNFGRQIQSNIHGNNLMDGSTKVLVDVPISKHGKNNLCSIAPKEVNFDIPIGATIFCIKTNW